MIQAEHIEKRFGAVRAVRGVSFKVGRGEAVGLLGPNGAGKTTTIRMITGFLPPDAGRVRIDGHDSLEQSLEARKRIGYLPESTPLYPEMTVLGLLRHRARLFRLPRRERRASVDRAIERCWLGEMRNRRVGALSKGYRQRVGLAAAILHDPPALLLDEPTNGLDPTQITQMRNLMRELTVDRAVIVSSHILSEVERTCDRVIVIAKGRVRADAPVSGLAGATSGARCIVEWRCPDGAAAEALKSALGELPAVVAMQEQSHEDGWRRTTLTTSGDATGVREQVGRVAQQHAAVIRELREESPSLERVFLDLISAEDEA